MLWDTLPQRHAACYGLEVVQSLPPETTIAPTLKAYYLIVMYAAQQHHFKRMVTYIGEPEVILATPAFTDVSS